MEMVCRAGEFGIYALVTRICQIWFLQLELLKRLYHIWEDALPQRGKQGHISN